MTSYNSHDWTNYPTWLVYQFCVREQGELMQFLVNDFPELLTLADNLEYKIHEFAFSPSSDIYLGEDLAGYAFENDLMSEGSTRDEAITEALSEIDWTDIAEVLLDDYV